MSLNINIELSDRDLQHFSDMKDAAIRAAADKSSPEVVQATLELLTKAQESDPPEFIKSRLLVLDTMVAMARDEAWALSEEDFAQVRSALIYFAAASDAIPDDVPVLGFLDDAIMIELCARELCHELDAYNDFCDYRDREAARRGLKPETLGRADWLSGRREELQERMRRRRSREGGMGTGYGASSGYGGGATRSYCEGWRPGVFKFR